ncbi:MFS transporter [Deinococcus deserti]|uniref:Putative Major facilitator superfamily MFS_1, putative membrane protein n=1 Tax=Deinococcus deserti (strain DSM 17065 / CIP 109153 / LMG 22923 / VCD115) TaxID=546414 RepID=C1CZH1_DEIDV|nr:MFS transporter [Deinococcus deserti]ACO47219.1 putative Major facilitator superfamily MFS_1, precursor; putative membrane protein [Deinococcus deserti VCD115]
MNARFAWVVAGCHFIAAFAALGLPPFFPLILERSLHDPAPALAGWLYVLPTLCAAFSAPLWGRLADRYGPRPLLLRAQLGLALSFLLTGAARTPWEFAGALALQGVLGGTFAASNTYLAALLRGPDLTRALTLMQGSARAALVVAPATLALFVGSRSPLGLYTALSVLPLLAALLLWRLPPVEHSQPEANPECQIPVTQAAGAALVFTLEAAFVFATIVTFPYFIPYVRALEFSPALWGAVFAVPHLVYLLFAPVALRRLRAVTPLRGLTLSLAALMVSLLGQLTPFLSPMVAFRVLMGLAMTGFYVWLHVLVVGLAQDRQAGRLFGTFEAVSKLAAVLAGVTAGLAAPRLGLHAPFVLGALVLLPVVTVLLVRGWLPRKRNTYAA